MAPPRLLTYDRKDEKHTHHVKSLGVQTRPRSWKKQAARATAPKRRSVTETNFSSLQTKVNKELSSFIPLSYFIHAYIVLDYKL